MITDDQLEKFRDLCEQLDQGVKRGRIPYQETMDWLTSTLTKHPITNSNDKATIIIDCDTDPFCRENWSVEEHIKGGQLEWDPTQISLYLCEEQKKDSIKGSEIREKLKDQPVLNACVLDYLIDNPQLIPEEWKGKYVFFWGTIYRNYHGYLHVSYLSWVGNKWDCSYGWLSDRFNDDDPAVVSVAS